MPQPPVYTPATDFSAEEANVVGGRSTVRTVPLDAELAAIEVTLDALCANIALIQRDDGEIRDGKVKIHTLAADLKALLTTYDCTIRGAWLTATAYSLKNVVTNGGVTYICAIAHTSGTFATDLAAGRWLALNSTNATDVAFTPQAGIAATNVSAALAEIGNQVGDGTGGMGFRNRIINGDMRIDQRNAGAALTINTAALNYCVDRWNGFGQAADGVFTLQRQAGGPTGFPNFLRAAVTTADASIGASQLYLVQQGIEGLNVSDLGWGAAGASAVTLSFWVRSSVTGTFSGSLRNNSNTRTYAFTYTINVANTWEFKTVTIAGDVTGTWTTDNTRGIGLAFDLGCGSGNRIAAGAWTVTAGDTIGATGAVSLISTLSATWDITGVQLEAGSVATPFERLSYERQLAACQRYCYRIGPLSNNVYYGAGFCNSVLNAYVNVLFPVTMRAQPVMTQSGTATAYGIIVASNAFVCNAVPALTDATVGNALVILTFAAVLTSGQGAIAYLVSGANGFLQFNAEL